MRSAVALLLTFSMLGCFPHDAKKRTIAQVAEGGLVVGGIALEGFLGTGADCDMMGKIGAPPDQNCHSRSTIAGNIGVALILVGLLGFVATISTAEDAAKAPPRIDIKAEKPADKPAETKVATPPVAPSGEGSGTTTTAAPPPEPPAPAEPAPANPGTSH